MTLISLIALVITTIATVVIAVYAGFNYKLSLSINDLTKDIVASSIVTPTSSKSDLNKQVDNFKYVRQQIDELF